MKSYSSVQKASYRYPQQVLKGITTSFDGRRYTNGKRETYTGTGVVQVRRYSLQASRTLVLAKG